MTRFFRSLAAIFRPPFNGLGLVVLLYFAWAQIVYPHNDIMRGDLPDPDDYMYLAQALDWLKGQSWYDNIQHRLDPGAGTPIHFSRFAMLPLAAGIRFFQLLGLPARNAAIVTALIEPLFLLAGCLAILKRIAACVMPCRWAGATAYVALFSVGLLFEFMPGHVDHHGLVIVMVLASVACVLRLIDEPQDHKPAIAAGLILAAALMIALECLPWVLLLSAWLGVWSMQRGGKAAQHSAAFAAAFLVGSVACLALTRPPSTILTLDILTYSAVYILLAAAIAVPFAAVSLASQAGAATRWAVGLILAILCAELFLQRFPELATGPYGGIDPRLLPLLLDEVEEAQPILHATHGGTYMLNFMSMSLLALPCAAFFLHKARDAERWKWSLLVALQSAAIGLAVFYQYRFMGMSAALAVVPLTIALQRGWWWAALHLQDRKRFLVEIGLLLAVGPLPAVIVPSLFDHRSFDTGFLLFPVDSGRTPCDMHRLLPALRDPNGLGDRPRLIASVMELGPELLFRTDDGVLAAPFHLDVQGNLDSARFLATTDVGEAQSIAKRRSIELVAACNAVPDVYLGERKAGTPMIERLFKSPPPWLVRVDVPGLDNFVLLRVAPEKFDSAADAISPQSKKDSRN